MWHKGVRWFYVESDILTEGPGAIIHFSLLDLRDDKTSFQPTLTHRGRARWSPFSQTIFSYASSWMRTFDFQTKFHWNMFLAVLLTINHRWFRVVAEQATSHYLNQWWYSLLTHICVTWPQWVFTLFTDADLRHKASMNDHAKHEIQW